VNERMEELDRVNNLAMWYPKCRAGFYQQGCCICSPVCPSGFKDSGANCFKPTYGRGVGQVRLQCIDGKVADAGLCYPPCPAGTSGVGPLCWGNCSKRLSTYCGLFCTVDSGKCAQLTMKIVGSALKIPLQAYAGDGQGVAESVSDIAGEIVDPDTCEN